MKKYIVYSLWLLLAVMAFQACKQDSLMTFDQKPNVYFTYLDSEKDRTKDSTSVLFVSMPPDQMETTIKIPVKVTGILSDIDRRAAFEVVDTSTTAIAGTDYELPEFILIPADSTEGHITIRIFRTAELKDTVKKLTLRLIPNEEFTTEYKARLVDASTGESRSVLEYSIYFSDKLMPPRHWHANAFGTWSRTKILKICEVNGCSPDWFNGTVEWNGFALGTGQLTPTNTMLYLVPPAVQTNVWLNKYKKDNGTPFLDENGLEMKMGNWANI